MIAVLFFSFSSAICVNQNTFKKESSDIVKFTNEIRAELGLNELKESEKLNQAAFNKALDMLNGQYFAHVDKSGRGLEHWIKDVDYEYSIAGENLAFGFFTVERMVDAWKKSPTHFDNIKNKNFKEIGVAMVRGLYDSVETNLAVQYFVRPMQKIQKNIKIPVVKAVSLKENGNKAVKVVENEIEIKSINKEVIPVVRSKTSTTTLAIKQKKAISIIIPTAFSLENDFRDMQTTSIFLNDLEIITNIFFIISNKYKKLLKQLRKV